MDETTNNDIPATTPDDVTETALRWADETQLTQRQAVAVVMSHRDDASRSEMAHALGVAESTVDQHLAEGRRKIDSAIATARIVADIDGFDGVDDE